MKTYESISNEWGKWNETQNEGPTLRGKKVNGIR